MSQADLDPADVQDYRGFLDSRGLSPAHFQVAASAGQPGEGELGTSDRTATVTHLPSGTARTYSFRTWVADFRADYDAGAYPR